VEAQLAHEEFLARCRSCAGVHCASFLARCRNSTCPTIYHRARAAADLARLSEKLSALDF